MLAPRIGIYTVCAYEHMPEARLELLQNHLVKYLRLQTYPNFDLFITCRASERSSVCGIGSPESDRLLASLDYGRLNIRMVHADHVPYEDYTIQVRVDSDDILLPDFCMKLMALWHETPYDRFLATFNPYIYDCATATLHGGVAEWSAAKPSMFSALFQRHAVTDQIRRMGMHCHLGKYVQYVRFIEEGYCVWTRHGQEQFTQPEQFPETGYSWRVKL